jgi:hypothetical protein
VRLGKYYVYVIEKDKEVNRMNCYVGPLDKIVEFYISSEGIVEGNPHNLSLGPGDCAFKFRWPQCIILFSLKLFRKRSDEARVNSKLSVTMKVESHING